jgi:dolichol-phosphate mannosyltransferase
MSSPASKSTSADERPVQARPSLSLLSVVIPARDEAGCIASTVEHLHLELRLNHLPHEIIVVDDGSTDETWRILTELQKVNDSLRPVQNPGPHGFGRAIIYGLDHAKGDALVIMMADESDDCRDVVRYWKQLSDGYDCVFGSRFIAGGGVIDYPRFKLWVNRLANLFIRILFKIKLNDTTNAFKAYRRSVIDGCRPLISPHFNLTVELPLKAIVRGYTWTVIPITWRNRRTGKPKLQIQEMGSRYLFVCLYIWLEKYFSRGDYRKAEVEAQAHHSLPEKAATSNKVAPQMRP